VLEQELLGHSSFGVTADIYTHAGGDGQRDTAAAVEREIFGDLLTTVPDPASEAANAPLNQKAVRDGICRD